MTLPPQVFDLLLNKLVKISSGRGHNIFHTLHTKDYLKIDFKVFDHKFARARGGGGGGLSNTNDGVARRKFLIYPLKETNLGVALGFWTPKRYQFLAVGILISSLIDLDNQNRMTAGFFIEFIRKQPKKIAWQLEMWDFSPENRKRNDNPWFYP